MSTNQIDWAGEVATALSAMKEEGARAYTYLKQEAPEIGAEYVKWKMVSGFAGSLPLIFASGIAFAIAVKTYRLWKKESVEIRHPYDRSGFGFGSCLALAAACSLLFGAFATAATSIKCIVAPRIVLIEGIKEIVK
jgi:hypothetical protein